MNPEGFYQFTRLAPEAHFLVDGGGMILAVNGAAERLLGRSGSGLDGAFLGDLVEEDATEIRSRLRALSGTRGPITLGLTFLAADGDRIPCACLGGLVAPRSADHPQHLLFRADPRITGTNRFRLLNEQIHRLNREIRRRRRAEWEKDRLLDAERTARAELEARTRDLAEATATLKAVIGRLPVGISVLEAPSGRRLYANEEAERLLGHPIPSAPSYEVYAEFGAIHEGGRPYDPEEYPTVRALLQGEEIRDESMRYLRPDGEETVLSVSSTPVRDPEGRIVAAVSTFQDVTEQREAAEALTRAKEAAEAASRAKTDFLAAMSHELRTPLSAVVGYVELLAVGIGGEVTATQGHYLGRIESAANHLLQQIDEILSLSRIEAGEEEVRLESVDAGELALEITSLLRPLAERRGLRVEFEAPGPPVTVHTDPGKVRQILLNLLSNAVKFTDAGSVGIRLRPDGAEQVLFEVWDTGIGIDPNDEKRVFDRFWQADSARSEVRGGTGLGLALCRELSVLLGGGVTLESTSNAGSTFVLRLPRQASRPTETPPRQ